MFRTPKGQAGPPVSVPNGFVLFRVLTRKEASRDTFQAQKEELRESLRSREAERLTRSYLSQLRAERKVEVNEPLLASFMREGSSGARDGGPSSALQLRFSRALERLRCRLRLTPNHPSQGEVPAATSPPISMVREADR